MTQNTVCVPPTRKPESLSPKAKKVLFWALLFIALPLPIDWVPFLGDVVDVATFLIGSLAMVNASRGQPGEAR